MTLPVLDQPTPCYGRAPLFESTNPIAHREAKRLCATCHAFAACDRERIAVGRAYRALEGTWAGRLYNSRSEQVD